MPAPDFNGNLFAAGKPWFDVTFYGAKGDGVTDDTTAIQNAINAANTAGGGTVYFPNATYMVTTLTMKADVVLLGASRYTTILRQRAALTTTNFITGSSISGFHFRELTLDGQSLVSTGNYAQIGTLTCSNWSAQQCRFINFDKFGVAINGDTYARIENCYFSREVAANTQNQAINISSAGGNAQYLQVNNCWCVNSGLDISASLSQITHNVILNWKFGAGITVEQSTACFGLDIVGNVCAGGTGTDVNSFNCGGIENWAKWSTIANNICYNNSGNGIDQGGSACSVTGNVCIANGVTSGSGIAARYGDANYNGGRSMYAGNTCYDPNGGTGTQLYGYTEQSASIGYSYLGVNNFSNNKTAPTNVVSATTSIQNPNIAFTQAWTPTAVATGATLLTNFTVSGARLGDIVMCSYDQDMQGCGLIGYVNTSNDVVIGISNNTGSSKTLTAGNIRGFVIKPLNYATY